MKKLFLLYVVLIVHFSLYPWRFLPVAGRVLAGWSPMAGRSDYLDVVANLLFYMPLGALGVLAWEGLWPALAAGGTALSLTLEVAQAWIPGRDSSIRDVVMNGLGTVAGIALGFLFSRHWPSAARRKALPIRGRMPIVLASAWLVGECFPFMPITRLAPLRESLLQLVRPASLPWLGLAETFVSCLLLAHMLRGPGTRSGRQTAVLLAFLTWPLRLFLQGSSFSWAEVGTAASAFALSVFVFSRFRGEAKLLGALALLLVAVKEFSPFVLASAPAPFHFVPFAGFLEASRDAAIRVTAQKFFLYGSSVWILRAAGLPLWGSTGAVTLLLAAGEATQRYLPGRVPESTDPLLALVAGLLMVWLRNRRAADKAQRW